MSSQIFLYNWFDSLDAENMAKAQLPSIELNYYERQYTTHTHKFSLAAVHVVFRLLIPNARCFQRRFDGTHLIQLIQSSSLARARTSFHRTKREKNKCIVNHN